MSEERLLPYLEIIYSNKSPISLRSDAQYDDEFSDKEGIKLVNSWEKLERILAYVDCKNLLS